MSTGENAHRAYRFGEFTLDLDREALYRGHRELHLRPKAFRVLEILLENSGRLVSKAELHEAAWAESVVTDDSLAHCIGDIRHTLGDSGFELIRTVPRRGYVFENAVRETTGDRLRSAVVSSTRRAPLPPAWSRPSSCCWAPGAATAYLPSRQVRARMPRWRSRLGFRFPV